MELKRQNVTRLFPSQLTCITGPIKYLVIHRIQRCLKPAKFGVEMLTFALKFGRWLSSNAVEPSDKFQSHWKTVNTNLTP